MLMRHQQERLVYQDQLQPALTTALGNIEKGESSPSLWEYPLLANDGYDGVTTLSL
jgi:hypothetical protein